MRRRAYDRRFVASSVNAIYPLDGSGNTPAGRRLEVTHSLGKFEIRIRDQPMIVIRHHDEGVRPEPETLMGIDQAAAKDPPAFIEGCLKPILII